jgi:hypothetical protein
MKTLFQIAALGIISLLTACEGNTDYTWKVANNSSTSITAYSMGILDTTANVKQIASSSTEIILLGGQMGGNSTAQEPETYLSSLIIINTNGDTAQKDFTDLSNWETSIDHVKKTPSFYEHEYTFSISDTDF